MKTIRFTGTGKPQFAAAVRKNVNAYFREKNFSTKGGWRMTLKTLAMLGLYVVPFVFVFLFTMNPWVFLLLSVVMGAGMAGTGMAVMHDAAHGSYSRKDWMNKIFSGTIYLLGGNLFNWKIQHNVLHHTFTNIEGYDEDIRSRVVIRMSKHAPLNKFHRFQHLYVFFLYSLMTLMRLGGDFFQLHEYNRKGLTKANKAHPVREYVKLVVGKVMYLLVALGLPLLLVSQSWWMILLAFVVMHLTAGMIMSVVFQLAHVVEGAEQPVPDGQGSIANDWMIHELMTTANFSRRNRLLSWYIGGLNFQIEHHLFPGISHVHYHRIAPIVERTAREFGLPYNQKPTFFHAFISHVRMLKELGRLQPVPVRVMKK
ncbi:MAG TPA: acyl-CoA desaturase [Bacteroidia bacterium]|nr:acyl-CoA desaturase [Bacteroidia bacterium]